MKRAVSLVMVFAMFIASAPATILAAQNTGSVSGTAVVEGKPLPQVTVRLRNVADGRLVGTATTNQLGQFQFTGLSVGEYVVETVAPNGTLLGTSAKISLTSGAMIAGSVTVTTSAAAASAAGLSGAGTTVGTGGSFFGSTLGIVTIAAAAGGLTTAVVAAKKDASPSR
jgi:hypothetical protein